MRNETSPVVSCLKQKKKKKTDSEELKVDENGNSISSEKDVHAMKIWLACINKKNSLKVVKNWKMKSMQNCITYTDFRILNYSGFTYIIQSTASKLMKIFSMIIKDDQIKNIILPIKLTNI